MSRFSKTPIAAAFGAALLALALTASLPAQAGKAHEHGVAKLDLALEGNVLSASLDTPLDNLLGFERAPRTDAERRAAAELLQRLRKGEGVLSADAAAQCSFAKATVKAPVLEPAGATAGAKSEHADLEASFEFRCAQPQQLRAVELSLFDSFKRMQRIDVQVVGPQGQSKVTLRRPAKQVRLVR